MENTQSKQRYAYFDYLKYVLIFLVVLGHILEKYTNNPLIKSIYLFIYSFHMPLFVLICGIFAKYNKKRIIQLLLIYFIFNYLIFIYDSFSREIYFENFSDFLTEVLKLQWAMWFVLALPIWLFTTKYITIVKPKHILYSFIIALLVGFIPVINSVLSLSRIFYFYPFFLLGKMLGQNKSYLITLISKSQNLTTKFSAILTLLFTFVFLYFLNSYLSINFFYGSIPYAKLSDVILRIFAFVLAIACSFSVMILVPVKSTQGKHFYSISTIGQRTLSIYLFHITFIELIYLIISLFDWNVLTTIIFSVILTFAVIILFSLPFFTQLINKIQYKKAVKD